MCFLLNFNIFVVISLFGVLDQSFAEQYKRDIKLIQQNEHHLTDLLKNQTSIIEAEYNVLKRTEQNIQIQHKTINKHLNELDQATNTIKQTVERISATQDFTLSALTAVNLIQNLKSIQNTLLDTITDIYHGKFNIHLLTPEQLKTKLQFISGQLTKDVTLPVDNIQSDVKSIYSMLRVKARVMTDYVIFEITFPLICRDSYQIYKILPVPHQSGTDMLNVLPVAEFIAINLRKDTYLTISLMELQLCLHTGNSYLCHINKPVNYLPSDEKFCKINHTNQQCRVSKSQCKDMWMELNDLSKYFYFCCDTYSLRIICPDQVSYKRVTGAGIISIESKCIIKGKDFALYSRSHSQNIINSDLEIVTPQITELNHLINISLSHVTESVDPLNNTLDDIEKRVNQLKAATANTSSDLSNLSTHDVHQYTICYGLLGIAIVAAAVFLWKKRRAPTGCLTQTAVPTVMFTQEQSIAELQPGDVDQNQVNVVNIPRKQSTADRQPSEVNFIASTYSINSRQDIATSPIPQKRNGYREDLV